MKNKGRWGDVLGGIYDHPDIARRHSAKSALTNARLEDLETTISEIRDMLPKLSIETLNDSWPRLSKIERDLEDLAYRLKQEVIE